MCSTATGLVYEYAPRDKNGEWATGGRRADLPVPGGRFYEAGSLLLGILTPSIDATEEWRHEYERRV